MLVALLAVLVLVAEYGPVVLLYILAAVVVAGLAAFGAA